MRLSSLETDIYTFTTQTRYIEKIPTSQHPTKGHKKQLMKQSLYVYVRFVQSEWLINSLR